MTLADYLTNDIYNALYEGELDEHSLTLLAEVYRCNGVFDPANTALYRLRSCGYLDYKPYTFTINEKGIAALREYGVIR